MSCPHCQEFSAGLDIDTEPEFIDELTIDEAGNVNGAIRIVNTCNECGADRAEAQLDVDDDHSEACKDHVGPEHRLSVEEGTTERFDYFKGRRHFYGARISYEITCSCESRSSDGEPWHVLHEWEDSIQASHMDEA